MPFPSRMLHPVHVKDGVLSPQECAELIALAKSIAPSGYRDNVTAATMDVVIAANPAFLVPIVPIRERVRDLLESLFQCECELWIEFTGLMSWRQGASIGWHHDANREYLTQRHYAAVVYLNNHMEDFRGGEFLYKPCAGGDEDLGRGLEPGKEEEEEVLVAPRAGRVVMYDARTMHCVRPVDSGSRHTIAMWFTRDVDHSEDARLLPKLDFLTGPSSLRTCSVPDSMYTTTDGAVRDVRLARMAELGLQVKAVAENENVTKALLEVHHQDKVWEDVGSFRIQRVQTDMLC